MLDREDTQSVVVQIKALVVRQEDLVHFVVVLVSETTLEHVYYVECVLLHRTPLRGRERFIVLVHLVEGGTCLWNDGGCPDYHVSAVFREETALPVELLVGTGSADAVF